MSVDSFRDPANLDVYLSVRAFCSALAEDGASKAVSLAAADMWETADLFWEAIHGLPEIDHRPCCAKTICVYYFSLGMGGGERVTAEVASLFVELGFRVVLLTDAGSCADYYSVPGQVKRVSISGQTYGPDGIADRMDNLESLIVDENIDVFN